MTGVSGPRIGRSISGLAAQGDRDFKWTTLDPAGYQGPIPDFPLPDVRPRELLLWQELWRTPQAIEWARLDLVRNVALYCRKFVDNELPGSKAGDLNILRQMTDSLGLSIPGMRAARWRISDTELDEDELDEVDAPKSVRERVASQ